MIRCMTEVIVILACLPGRKDDLPYQAGPPVQGSLISEDEFKRIIM